MVVLDRNGKIRLSRRTLSRVISWPNMWTSWGSEAVERLLIGFCSPGGG